MELRAPDRLHVLQPSDRYEPGLAVLVAVICTAVQKSVSGVVGSGGRLVTADGCRRRRRWLKR